MRKNIFNDIIAFEEGTLDEADIIPLFQRLIDDGSVWRLQGSYGRIATALIAEGKCMLGLTGYRDYCGSYIPSRFEVRPGAPGSLEYVEKQSESRD